jgi:hypothetical protein
MQHRQTAYTLETCAALCCGLAALPDPTPGCPLLILPVYLSSSCTLRQVCGTLGLLFMPMPLLAKQWYNIWTGIVTAYIFTWIPEWTSWVLIVVMAIYDILAVLIPGGPLNVIIWLPYSTWVPILPTSTQSCSGTW